MISREEAKAEFRTTLVLIRETIRCAIIDSLTYPAVPIRGDKYFDQRMYHHRRMLKNRDKAREWFREMGDYAGGFRMMWEGIRICGGPSVCAERILERLEEVWSECDAEPELSHRYKDQLKMASTIFGDE